MPDLRSPWLAWCVIAIGPAANAAWGQGVSFTVAPSFQAGSYPWAVAAGDFNGDGRADLAVANNSSGNVSVLLNNGNGGFLPAVNYTVGTTPSSIAIGDFNGDGKADQAVANYASNNVSILLGNGNGGFQLAVSYAAGNHPEAVATGDFNGDGKADLVVADSGDFNGAGSGVSLLPGNGNGTFQAATLFTAGSGAQSVAVGDFNADNKTDLAVANSGSHNVSVLLGNGNGTFQTAVNYGTSTTGTSGVPTSVVAGDLNGDGKLDLAVASPWLNDVSVLLGYGNGAFQAPVHYAQDSYLISSLPDTLAVADLNGDGKADLVVANGNANHISVLLGNGSGAFPNLKSYAAGARPQSVAIADFNGDGKPDLAVANNDSGGGVSLLTGNGDGTFQAAPVYRAVYRAQSIAVADFDGDGKLDLAEAGAYDSTVAALLGNANGSFRPQVIYGKSGSSASVAVGNFDGDGKPDLVIANSSQSSVGVSLGNGNGTFRSAAVTYTVGTTPRSIAVGDFNGDGKSDTAVANSGSHNVSILLGNADGTFRPVVNYSTAAGGSPYSVAAADFNRDGKLDLAVANSSTSSASILLGNGDGTFQAPLNFVTGTFPHSIAVADLNGDGAPDLATADWANSSVSVLLGNGNGTFQPAVPYTVGSTPETVGVGDLNGDGKPDLVATTPSGISVLLGNGNGTMQAAITYAVQGGPGSPGRVAAGDFNGDGKPDLAVADTVSDMVAVLLNTTIVPPAATHFAVSGPASATQGVSFNFTVTALDASNNSTSNYAGTVRFTSSDSAATLPANAALSGGTGTFSATLRSAGNQTVTAGDSGNPSITGSSAAISVRVPVPPPAIALLSPNPMSGSGSAQVLTIAGTGFASGLTVQIGSNSFPAAQLLSLSPTQIQVSLVTGTISQSLSVKIVNPDGQTSNAVTLQVNGLTGAGPFSQQGGKLVGTGAAASNIPHLAVATSADGNTALLGSWDGHVWTFTRSGGVWSQRGGVLTGSGCFGSAVALSADAATALIGAFCDRATWVYTQTNGVWTQQAKLVGAGAVGTAVYQGLEAALSADGNTAIIGGGYSDNNDTGAAWIFVRANGIWSQQGDKLVGTGAVGAAQQGWSVGISGDGNTAIVGGVADNNYAGASWIFVRSNGVWAQQGAKLAGGGWAGALPGDGNTAIAGSLSGASVFVRSGGVWSQQGSRLVGTGSVGSGGQGRSVSLSADGNTALVGGPSDNGNTGASWVFRRSNGVWNQLGNKLVGSGAAGAAQQGTSVALSGDGGTAIVGGPGDNGGAGAAWVLAAPPAAAPALSPATLTPSVSAGAGQTLTATFNAPGGYQALDVLNILINNYLDGRQACYLAYSRPSNALYIVSDVGDPTQITGKVMDGTGTVGNSQCTVALAGSSATGNGNTFTLALNLSFAASFGGNKVVYAAARDVSGNNSGWQTMGVHGVPPLPSTFPMPAGMSPPSGNTLSQTLTFTYQDQSSAANLQTVWALISTAIDGRAACYIAYYRPGNQVYLYPDNGDGNQAANIVLTGNNTISNSQCTISAQGASVQTAGSTLTVTLPVTFKPAFAGFKGVWMAAQTMGGAQTSPWQALGAEAVPAQ
jgi:hypothetical protein